jgi:hypothetical protein
MNDFMQAVEQVVRQQENFLMVGRRWDLDIDGHLDFKEGWEDRLQELVNQNGKLHPETGIDYFVFPRGFWGDIPPFAIGRTSWDNWLVFRARTFKAPLVDASSSVIAVHQNHDYSYSGGNKESILRGPEAQRNRNLLGGFDYSFNIFDATYVINHNKIIKPKDIWHIWRYFNRLPLLFPLPGRINPMLIKVGRFSHHLWLRLRSSQVGNC